MIMCNELAIANISLAIIQIDSNNANLYNLLNRMQSLFTKMQS